MGLSQTKLGAILSYFQMGIGAIINIIYTPVLIRLLGQNEYGLYSTVISTMSMLSVLNLGFSAGYVRYYSIYKKENNKEAIYRLNGLFLLIFSIIGLIAFICGLFIAFNLQLFFSSGLTIEEYQIAKKLVLLLTVSTSISFTMSVFTNIITANERFVFLKTVSMLHTVLVPIITLPLLLIGLKSVAVVSVSLTSSVVIALVYLFYVTFVLRNKFIFTNFQKGIFNSLFTYTIFIAVNIIVDQINWNIDKILLGRFIGTAEVAIYSVGYTLYTYYMTFSTSISSIFTPKIHRIVNEYIDNKTELRNQLTTIFIKVGRIQFIILCLVCTGFFFFGKEFIGFWVGKGYDKSYYVALILMFSSIVALIQNLGIEIQRAQNIHQFRSVVYLIMAFINFGISIVLCQIYGAVGSTIGTAVSLLLANGLIMNVFYARKCNIRIGEFWKEILSISKALLLPIIVGVLFSVSIKNTSTEIYILKMSLYVGVYIISMWRFGLNNYEKNIFKTISKKVILRFKNSNN